MPERFERLYELPSNLYSAGSPVIVSAGALLKDKQTGSIIVQLKFQSTSSTLIKALKVGIVAYDIAGKEVTGVEEYQYLDLQISEGQAFGSNKAIVMPNVVTRSFSIGSITAVLADGTVRDVSMPMTALPKATPLQSGLNDAELVKQYRLAVNNEAVYIPQETDHLWMCSCGEWSFGDFCTGCRATKAVVFSAYDIPTLTEKMAARLAAEQTQQEEQQRLAEIERQQKAEQLAFEKEKHKADATKVKILLAIALPTITLVLTFALWLYPDIIKPNIAYKEAERLFSEGKYSDAVTAFQALGNFKDSPDRLNEIIELMIEDRYDYGERLMQDKDYDNAILIFENVLGYGGNKAILDKAEYQKAICLAELGKMEEAITCLENVSGYSDSAELLQKIKYQYACNLFSRRDYEKAETYFQSVLDYEDSATMALECVYQQANLLFADAKYIEAIELFSTITDYSDSAARIDSTYSLYYFEQGNTCYEEAKFYLAIENYQKSNEPATTEMISKAENEIAYINSVCGKYRLVEEYWYGSKVTIGPANRDNCVVSFDFEEGRFVFDNNKYVSAHSFKYNFDKEGQYHYENHYSGGKNYYYAFENGRLFWCERSDTYEYYEKE